MFSKKSIENGLSFTDVSPCLSYTSWLNDTIIVYFLAYLQKSDTGVMSLSAYFYSDFVASKTNNNFYLQFTTPNLFNKKIIYIPINKNDIHWLLVVILPHYQTVISTDSLSYDNENIVQLAMQFLRIYATLHKVDFKAENWNFLESWYTKTEKIF